MEPPVGDTVCLREEQGTVYGSCEEEEKGMKEEKGSGGFL
jgi:hypothetical protein